MNRNFFEYVSGISERMASAKSDAVKAKTAALESNSFNPLSAFIIDGDRFVSQAAVDIVKNCAFEIGTTILSQGLVHNDKLVQKTVIAALGIIGNDKAIEAISNSISVRFQAVSALTHIQSRQTRRSPSED
jgi:HEAT repeat protein